MRFLIPLDESDISLSILPSARRLLAPCLRADARLAGLLSLLPAAEVPDCPVPSAEVHLLTVLRPRRTHELPVSPLPELPAEFEAVLLTSDEKEESEQVGARLEQVAREHFADTINSCHVLWSESPADAIVAFAEALDVDAIVMATHGRSAVGRLLAGSVTERVIRRATRPVVVQRPPLDHGPAVRTEVGAALV